MPRRAHCAGKERHAFLDEVDTLSSKAQVDLLRVLQDKLYRAIGSGAERQADVRILAANNASLDGLLRNALFRPDLYYRLLHIYGEPARCASVRKILHLLAAHFLAKHGVPQKPELRLTPEACASLLEWDWPGNVRELENAILRAIHLCPGDAIETADLGLQTYAENHAAGDQRAISFSAAKQRAIAVFEKDYLTRLMAEQDGNISQAARIAGKDRSDLGKLLKKHQLDARVFRSPASSSTS